MSLKRKASDPDDEPPFFRSQPVEDRQSTFIGFYSPSLKPKELQSLPELKTADHKVAGWRRESNQQSIGKAKLYVSGSDDDGEKYAGKKIEKVMEVCNTTGSVVVARWWGGIMLGPVRFTHIETVARDSIRACESHRAEAGAKRRKAFEEKEEHAKLCKTLADRDGSIVVLRKLAADKEQKLKDIQDGATASSPPSAKAPTDYSALPLERLRALEKARDATLSFLLKRIDKAEGDLAKLAVDAG
ncbi:hypothetical protein CERZMDRAFT_51028 [Cercospora zeae-maydis SCOH1-5]|uniref:Impact N-terminal domain-containing protein n=1 Tax=Cercospora zeae-maydis SCOH1-5 TaxID=717836 RepID=A0A6A6F2V5_9PEZI|nr:hypothetical protein CERZMDRAFT_51028 [Cercospora zeae-maydis SCOH1-5]